MSSSTLLGTEIDGDVPENTQRYIEALQGELDAGFGFVPFIGAGFSAPSGAPITIEFQEYLQRCICVALGIDITPESPIPGNLVEPWNPRSDRWPPFIDRRRDKPAGYWREKAFTRIRQMRDSRSRLSVSDDAAIKVLSEGYGAMQDWRTALLFLSRLVRQPRRAADGADVWLEPPSQEVIDSCFQEVLRGTHPTLGHRMLAALGGALRLDLVLTTNFDNLLERAFETARNPLTVSEVALGDSLPHWSAIRDSRTLVKLHGGRSAIRADYSLDQEPSEEDKERFLQYLLGSADTRGSRGRLPAFQKHLLVLGVAGHERRISSLIEHAVQHDAVLAKSSRDRTRPPSLHIYWICYSNEDLASLETLARSLTGVYYHGRRVSSTARRSPVRALRHPELGLFLLHLYQTIRRSLPPLGAIFPSVSRQTLPPLEGREWRGTLAPQEEQLEKFVEQLITAVDTPSTLDPASGARAYDKPILATSVSGGDGTRTSGLVSACARAYRRLETRADIACLWLDMNDISSADNLYEVLLEAIYYRLGLEDWIPSTSGTHTTTDSEDHRTLEIRRLVNSVNRTWVLFLNARELPGANTDELAEELHGWIDRPAPSGPGDDPSSCNGPFVKLLKALCRCGKLCVVLLARNERLFEIGPNLERIPDPRTVRLWDTFGAAECFDEVDVVAHALGWACGPARHDAPLTRLERQRLRFLQGLVSMQRPRMLASIWSPALCDGVPRDVILGWLSDLGKHGLIRRKPGGFVWVHATCRQLLRRVFSGDDAKGAAGGRAPRTDGERSWDSRLRRLEEKTRLGSRIRTYRPQVEAQSIHKELARWYTHLLDASDSPGAAFEAAYHYCRAAEMTLAWASHASPQKRDMVIAQGAGFLDAATSLLRANSFLIQTHGYSKGSCRRLEFTAAIAERILAAWRAGNSPKDARFVERAVRAFWVVSAEVMRAIAREVGEDRKAFVRHRQVGRLMAGASWEDVHDEAVLSDLGVRRRVRGTPLGREVAAALVRQSAEDNARQASLLSRHDRSRSMPRRLTRRMGGRAAKAVPLTPAESARSGRGPLPALLRWWRWSGTLALNSRSYERSQRYLERVVGTIGGLNSDNRWTLAAQDQRLEVLRALEQAAHLCLLRASLAAQLGRDHLTLMHRAKAVIERGRDLAAKVRTSDRTGDARDTVQANWCEMRLLMHESIVTCSGSEVGRFADALGLLGQAEALLRVSDWRRTKSELALLDLHRAEVRRLEAENEHQAWKAQAPHGDQHRQRAAALVGDAVRFLERAEPVLRERRRNVYWTTWFFQRKLRAIALSIELSDENAPIPFLGLEAAMRLTQTEADRLLDDAKRMIRVDSYRLATVVDAYRGCCEALTAQAASRGRKDLPIRRSEMWSALSSALATLKGVHEARLKPVKGYEAQSELDGRVKVLVRDLSEKARLACEAANRSMALEFAAPAESEQ